MEVKQLRAEALKFPENEVNDSSRRELRELREAWCAFAFCVCCARARSSRLRSELTICGVVYVSRRLFVPQWQWSRP